jgi:hypothetical protein
MRVGVAWVQADGFAVGGLSVYVAVLAAKAVPCVSVLFRLGGGCGLARGGAGLAGGVGERVPDSVGAGAPGGVLGQERLKQVTQRAGVPWRGRRARQDGGHQRGQGGSVERRGALYGGVQGGAERPHIRGSVGTRSLQLLRRHVLGRADHHPGAGESGGRVEDPGDAEVGDDGAPARQQDVVRLEVAVHDPGGVRVAQRLCDLPANVGHARPGQARVPADLRAQGGAGDEFHNDPGRAVVFDHVVDRDDARMGQPRCRPRLP